PVSSPSLIQNITVAASTGRSNASEVNRYAIGLDTLASVGRNAFIARTLVDERSGARVEDLRVQHIRDKWRGSAGLLQSQSSGVLRSYRLYGLEMTNLTGTRLVDNAATEVPIDIVLPERATVEIYRNNVLVSARHYAPGLQVIKTDELPRGTYPINIIARAGGMVILEESRIYSKTGGLPPRDQFVYEARLGIRADNNFLEGPNGETDIFPRASEKIAAELRVSKRIGLSLGATAGVTYIDDAVYPELGFDWFPGLSRFTVNGAVGSKGGYSTFASASSTIGKVNFALSARSIRASDDGLMVAGLDEIRPFEPFLRNEDQLYGSVSTRILGGSFTLSTSQTFRESPLLDGYRHGMRYSRNVDVFRSTNAFLSLDASVSEQEERVGIRLAFSRKLSSVSRMSGGFGGESIRRDSGLDESGPIADIQYARLSQIGSIDVSSRIGANLDSRERRIYAGAVVASELGTLDLDVSTVSRKGTDKTFTTGTMNGQTGFALTKGAARFGLREPGEALVMMRIKAAKVEPKIEDTNNLGEGLSGAAQGNEKAEPAREISRGGRITQGGYRVVVNNRDYGFIDGLGTGTIGLPALDNYKVSLSPDGAPPYDLDLTARDVPLYPGNIVVIDWEAIRVATVFGRLMDANGNVLIRSRIETGGDMTITDDNGYFTMTASLDTGANVILANGNTCSLPPLNEIIGLTSETDFYSIGDITCQ
ncbi:MAG: CS1-pili formation C-terminal domain-containing protein, partial [Robiginitomaculum sp.]